jgi:pimeloyl-ACP methyl ester carboxylesterase/N-acetylglutamate synthase-like GNAT family acetyltransferase
MAESLHSVTRGSGTPVLLVHGWSVDHRIMLPLERSFVRHRFAWERVYVDLPGHGASPADASITTADDVAAALDAFVDERFGDRPFAVVGSSFGGVLARRLVARRPSQLLGVALLCPSAEPVEHRALPEREVRVHDEALLASLDPADRAEYEPMAVVQSPETWALFRDFVLPGLRAADQGLAARVGDRPAVSWRPEDAFDRFDRPALMVLGRQDQVVGWQDQLEIAPSYTRMTVAVLDGAGHNAHLEHPAEVRALLRGWLDALAMEGAGSHEGGLRVREARPKDQGLVSAFLAAQHADVVARQGELVDARQHPALVAEAGGVIVGVATLFRHHDTLEVLTIHAIEPGLGVGTALLDAAAARGRALGCRRLWLVTTNDNTDAIRFYQRRGMRLVALRTGAVDEARATLKPAIPETGDHGIPLRDELVLELALD